MCQCAADSSETERLLRQARRGDARAFDRLFALHRGDLCRMVELRLDEKLRQRMDPSDVVQEAQLEAYRRLQDFLERRPMPFGTWLRKTTYERLLNVRRNHLGAARRAVSRETPLPERSSLLLARQLVAGGSTPSQHLARREFVEGVRRAVGQLSDTDREVLLMRSVEGLAHEEVGHVLGIDAAAARKRYGRALLRLRTLLVESGVTGSGL